MTLPFKSSQRQVKMLKYSGAYLKGATPYHILCV